jgi:drug/metabolite transporter (DMT)-like permease
MPAFHFGAVGGFSLLSGLLALLVFWFQCMNGLTMPGIGAMDWLYLLLISLGPIALANLTWKQAIKDGDPGIVGAFSYLTPLLSTLNLGLFGSQQITLTHIAAMILILSGAVIGGKEPAKAN